MFLEVTFRKLLSHWLNGFTAFSIIPLRISTGVGVSSALIGFLFAIYTILRKLIFNDVNVGYSSLISVILFIGGLNMMMMGMLGEYVGRIYISLNKSPQYCVRETINIERLTTHASK